MEILQLIPAQPGTKAVFAVADAPNGWLQTAVFCFALVETDEAQLIYPVTEFDRGMAVLDVETAHNCIGVRAPDDYDDEKWTEIASEFLEQQAKREEEAAKKRGN